MRQLKSFTNAHFGPCFTDTEGRSVLLSEVNISNDTKTGKRTVQVMSGGNSMLKQWRGATQFGGEDDLVWYGQTTADSDDVAMIGDTSKSFCNVLQRIPNRGRKDGLLYSSDSDKRTVYSLRHTYATYGLKERELNMEDLALNMGTSAS